MLACLLTTPVIFFPIPQVLEPMVGLSGAPARELKWCKNGFRTLLMLLSALVAIAGGKRLENFLAVIGALCCGPLAIMPPAALHLRICDPGPLAAAKNRVLVVFGAIITVFSTF